MNTLSIFWVFCCCVVLTSCSPPALTGEIRVFPVSKIPVFSKEQKQDTAGSLLEKQKQSLRSGYWLTGLDSASGASFSTADNVVIEVNSIFLKYFGEGPLDGGELVCFSEVSDSGDPTHVYRRVFFLGEDQSINSRLNFLDKIVFGPIAYTGNDIRLRLVIVELDKEENEQAKNVISSLKDVAAQAQPQYAPVMELGSSFMQYIVSLNGDDQEFDFHLTLHQTTSDANNAHTHLELRESSYILVKTENPLRFEAEENSKKAFTPYGKVYKDRILMEVDTNGKNIDSEDELADNLKEYRKHSYIAISVKRAPQGIERDVLQKISDIDSQTLQKVQQGKVEQTNFENLTASLQNASDWNKFRNEYNRFGSEDPRRAKFVIHNYRKAKKAGNDKLENTYKGVIFDLCDDSFTEDILVEGDISNIRFNSDLGKFTLTEN